MKPLVFDGRFGWLHAGQGTRGVVLCSPFGHESSWLHKGMRSLAEELSAYGLPTLRFDYLTTGDSAGIDGEGNPFDTFPDDICAAVARLRSETGVTHVTLCGLRLGATFAALASSRSGADSLVLLAPVTRGRIYRRELGALRMTWLENLAPTVRDAQTDTPLNVLGQIYGDAFCERLDAFDLAREMSALPSLPSRALLLDARPGASDALCATLRERGADVQACALEGYVEYMQESKLSVLPVRAIERAAQWVLALDPAPRVKRRANTQASPVIPRRDEPMIATPGAIERPAVFGTTGLFGILCEPRGRFAGGPVMLITNTAGSVHHGDSRLSVRVAREMARRGIPSLRIDARGIGDSPPRNAEGPPEACTSILAATISEDVATAAAWLKAQGYESVVGFGVCSGGYSALRASLVEPALCAVIAVNPPGFYIPEAISAAELEAQQRNSIARVAPALLKPAKWWLILSGKRSIRPVAKAIASYAGARVAACLPGMSERHTAPDGREALTNPRSVVRALERKGVRTLLIYGVQDEGLDPLNAYFGKHGKELSHRSCVKAAVFPDIDHALFDANASAKVVALGEAFIRELNVRATPAKGVAHRSPSHGSFEAGTSRLDTALQGERS